MQWIRQLRQFAVQNRVQLLHLKKPATTCLALLLAICFYHIVLAFTRPATTFDTAPLPLSSSYASTSAYYCARYGARGTAIAAACRATVAVDTTALPAIATPAPGCQAYDALFQQYDWNVAIAEAICQAESGGNPSAISPTNDYGLMQLHNLAVFDPAQNIAMAYIKYQVQGWRAWTTYNTGSYHRYL